MSTIRQSHHVLILAVTLLLSSSAYAELNPKMGKHPPHQCPFNGYKYSSTYWSLKEKNPGGVFVVANWWPTNTNQGQIECVYARPAGSLFSKFRVPRPHDPAWRQEGDHWTCQAVAVPEDCQF